MNAFYFRMTLVLASLALLTGFSTANAKTDSQVTAMELVAWQPEKIVFQTGGKLVFSLTGHPEVTKKIDPKKYISLQKTATQFLEKNKKLQVEDCATPVIFSIKGAAQSICFSQNKTEDIAFAQFWRTTRAMIVDSK
jgi:hypothetical protein